MAIQPPVPSAAPTVHRTITTTCRTHGAKGFCALRVTKTGGTIVLDPHFAESCVIELDEPAAAALLDALQEWLG